MMAGDKLASELTENTAASQPADPFDVATEPTGESKPTETPAQAEQASTSTGTDQTGQTSMASQVNSTSNSPYALLLDTFDRPDNDGAGSGPDGQGGVLAPLELAEPADGEDPSQSRIAGGKLILGNNSAATPGSHVVVKNNIAYSEVIEFNGFSVSLRVADIAAPESLDDPDGYWMGFGVGLDRSRSRRGGGELRPEKCGLLSGPDQGKQPSGVPAGNADRKRHLPERIARPTW